MVDLFGLVAVVASEETVTGGRQVGCIRFRLEDHPCGHVGAPCTHCVAEHPVLDSRMLEMGSHGQAIWAGADYYHLSAGQRCPPSCSIRIRASGGIRGWASGELPLGEAHVPGQGGERRTEVASVQVVVPLTVEKAPCEDRNGLPRWDAVGASSSALDVLPEPFDVTFQVPHFDPGPIAGHGRERLTRCPLPQQRGKGNARPDSHLQRTGQAGIDFHQEGAAAGVTAKLDFAVALEVQGAHERQGG